MCELTCSNYIRFLSSKSGRRCSSNLTRSYESARSPNLDRSLPVCQVHCFLKFGFINRLSNIRSISVASFSMSLELFEQLKNPTPDNEAIREEIRSALPTLEGLKQASQIAERGLNLVLPLLADEKRLQSEVVTDKKGKRKVRFCPVSTSFVDADESFHSSNQLQIRVAIHQVLPIHRLLNSHLLRPLSLPLSPPHSSIPRLKVISHLSHIPFHLLSQLKDLRTPTEPPYLLLTTPPFHLGCTERISSTLTSADRQLQAFLLFLLSLRHTATRCCLKDGEYRHRCQEPMLGDGESGESTELED